ncbi:hypothetical protein [Herbidospora daliensis]|uniref:hypothetical protein n=1 Tax=Herbidospora daliensis TaxID=295585 RepID=UPI0007833966|nr:hypothetical protein [Herbidospora daliensis]
MIKRIISLTVVVAAVGALAPATAQASAGQVLKLRKGLTITLPNAWKVHGKGDFTYVVAGKCKKLHQPGCRQFSIFGPKGIAIGNELFNPYTGKSPYYAATDVQPCPLNAKWSYGGGVKLLTSGYREIGKGHKAQYRAWRITCVANDSSKVKATFVQREWLLPKSKILIVDKFSTPGLSKVLTNAVWR